MVKEYSNGNEFYVCQEKGCPSSFIIVFEVETCIGLV